MGYCKQEEIFSTGSFGKGASDPRPPWKLWLVRRVSCRGFFLHAFHTLFPSWQDFRQTFLGCWATTQMPIHLVKNPVKHIESKNPGHIDLLGSVMLRTACTAKLTWALKISKRPRPKQYTYCILLQLFLLLKPIFVYLLHLVNVLIGSILVFLFALGWIYSTCHSILAEGRLKSEEGQKKTPQFKHKSENW